MFCYNVPMEKAIYRIIDANFNRAREALRVMEEFCRFAMNSKPLNAKIKDLRHKLSSAISQLDSAKLIASRDTVEDVGTDIKVDNQLSRTDLFDCFTAAAKRLPEALRALTETVQTINPQLAAQIEQLRYSSYTLEKEIVMSGVPARKFERVRLYVLITESQPEQIISLTKSCCLGGADCIQLRCKGLIQTDRYLLKTATEFVKICADNNVISVINDRPDIAILSNADGMHLGQDDIPVAQAKKLLLSPTIIGKSTHNIGQLKEAIAELPAYVGLGPAFDTQTKPMEKTAGLGYLESAIPILADTGVGHVAIGGIDLKNIAEVLKIGIKAVAICSAITKAGNPQLACAKFKEILADKEF